MTLNKKSVNIKNGICERCLHNGNITLIHNTNEYLIRKYKIHNCYFELVDAVCENKSANNFVDDLRGNKYV